MRTIPTFDQQGARVYVIHEHDLWTEPLLRELEQLGVPYESWHVDRDRLDLGQLPPEGIFYNRMSASSHTRGHRYAVELTATMLAWLQSHGRKVINNTRAMHLEIRKAEQYLALGEYGIRTPYTIVVNGREEAIHAAAGFEGIPFIFKPNRGGKGTDVRLFEDVDSFIRFARNHDFDVLDGIHLLQQYIYPANGSITRLEFVNGQFLYAVKVDASAGFELCPADHCQSGEQFCPADGRGPKFEVIAAYHNEDISKYEAFLAANGMKVAALEYAVNELGERYVYDVNINTNYNRQAEEQLSPQQRGMYRIARFLKNELVKLREKGVYQAAG